MWNSELQHLYLLWCRKPSHSLLLKWVWRRREKSLDKNRWIRWYVHCQVVKAREVKSTFNEFLSEKKREKENSDERTEQKESAIEKNRGGEKKVGETWGYDACMMRIIGRIWRQCQEGVFCMCTDLTLLTFVGLAEVKSVTIANWLTCMGDSRLSQSSWQELA